ncbi:MAG: hypothetical protein ACE5J7_02830 [Candidatus Aenigmatarchaeota archaeon]
MLGVILAIISGIMAGMAYFIQKQGVDSIDSWKRLVKSKVWLLGAIILPIAFLIHMAALRFERLVIVEPLINTAIITIVILEFLVLKERPSRTEIFAIIVFFMGIALLQVGSL